MFLKSQKGNEIWTFLEMSKTWKPKIVLKKGQKVDFDGDGHKLFLQKKYLWAYFFVQNCKNIISHYFIHYMETKNSEKAIEFSENIKKISQNKVIYL